MVGQLSCKTSVHLFEILGFRVQGGDDFCSPIGAIERDKGQGSRDKGQERAVVCT
jgi:hypothetical protein